jgi:hypothetical protein
MAIIQGNGIPNVRKPRRLGSAAWAFRNQIGPSFAVPRQGMAGLGFWDDDADMNPDYGSFTSYPLDNSFGTTWDWAAIANNVTKVGTALLSLNQQRELQELNIQRATRGLAPLSPSQYAPQMNVGIAQDTQKMLMFGAIGLGLVLLFSRRKG